MGCFLGCLRFREKEQPSGHQGNLPTVKNKEDTANNRTQSGSFDSSTKNVDCLESRKSENLCMNGSIKWDESLVKSTNVPSAPKTDSPSKHPISELIPPSTPPSVGKSRNPFEDDENRNFDEQVCYLKSCGAILKTPSEIRASAKRQRSPPKDDANENSDWHSWFPPSSGEAQLKSPPGDSPARPSHLYKDLSEVQTPTSMIHASEGLSTRFDEENHDIKGDTDNEKQKEHLACKDGDTGNDHDVVSILQESSFANEEIVVSPMSSKLLEPNQSRPSRYDQCANIEDDSDSFSDVGSISSHDSTSKNEYPIFKQFDSTPRIDPQTPPLFKSNFSPNPTPLILTEDMQTPWTTRTRENAAVNKNARIRTNYVHPFLNPVENLSQWKELKNGHAKNYDQDRFAGSGTPESRGSRIDSETKENVLSEEEMKLRCDTSDTADESGQKRKYAYSSPETFKTPKLSGESNQILEDTQSPETPMASALSHWLKTPPIAQERSSSTETLTPSSAVMHAHGLPKYKSIDDKPILGVVLDNMQVISAPRSPKSKACLDYDRPIIGIVAAHWNENQNVCPKWFDGNGIPNSTNKYKEDQKVRLHTTPFEERIEKALSGQGAGGVRKLFDGKTTTSEETEESDTAAS